MTVKFHEVMRPDSGLDRPILQTIINGETEWSPFKLERANKLLQQEAWYTAGEYIPIDTEDGIDDYCYRLDEVRRVLDCEFTPLTVDAKSDVVLTGNIVGVGPAILVELEELCTNKGVAFCEYFQPNINGRRNGANYNTEFLLPKFQRRSKAS